MKCLDDATIHPRFTLSDDNIIRVILRTRLHPFLAYIENIGEPGDKGI